ncbi:hypothetical protein RRG08_007978 [Elysia crispata]|uniref:Uncharacterized protein n=1 Tax=Elysia crispata TaxID=231223 RepID=A0AAE1DK11_9GAST|nr:hypothetical protein RRG08_007978 [Elysia crispata]
MYDMLLTNHIAINVAYRDGFQLVKFLTVSIKKDSGNGPSCAQKTIVHHRGPHSVQRAARSASPGVCQYLSALAAINLVCVSRCRACHDEAIGRALEGSMLRACLF